MWEKEGMQEAISSDLAKNESGLNESGSGGLIEKYQKWKYNLESEITESDYGCLWIEGWKMKSSRKPRLRTTICFF